MHSKIKYCDGKEYNKKMLYIIRQEFSTLCHICPFFTIPTPFITDNEKNNNNRITTCVAENIWKRRCVGPHYQIIDTRLAHLSESKWMNLQERTTKSSQSI